MSNHGPTHRVHTLIPRKDAEGQDDTFWLNIGAAFPHKDAKRCNLVLQAMPLDGFVRLRKMLPCERISGSKTGLAHEEPIQPRSPRQVVLEGRTSVTAGYPATPRIVVDF